METSNRHQTKKSGRSALIRRPGCLLASIVGSFKLEESSRDGGHHCYIAQCRPPSWLRPRRGTVCRAWWLARYVPPIPRRVCSGLGPTPPPPQQEPSKVTIPKTKKLMGIKPSIIPSCCKMDLLGPLLNVTVCGKRKKGKKKKKGGPHLTLRPKGPSWPIAPSFPLSAAGGGRVVASHAWSSSPQRLHPCTYSRWPPTSLLSPRLPIVNHCANAPGQRELKKRSV